MAQVFLGDGGAREPTWCPQAAKQEARAISPAESVTCHRRHRLAPSPGGWPRAPCRTPSVSDTLSTMGSAARKLKAELPELTWRTTSHSGLCSRRITFPGSSQISAADTLQFNQCCLFLSNARNRGYYNSSSLTF